MRITLHILLMVLILSISYTASSAENINKEFRYKNYDDIPEFMKSEISRNIYLDTYISRILTTLRQNAKDKKNLTTEDVERVTTQYNQTIRAEKLSKMVKHDFDFNGIIEKDEITKSLSQSSRYKGNDKYITSQISKIFQSDLNKDGKITYSEMSTLTEGEIERHRLWAAIKKIQNLISLDQNKDNTLSDQELEKLARISFATIDRNNNRKIDDNEYKEYENYIKETRKQAFNNRIRKKPKTNHPDTCSFGKDYEPPKDFVVYAVNAKKSKPLSFYIDYSSQVAHSVNIAINNTKPVVLFLGSAKPTIWTISKTKHTKISAILVSGNYAQKVRGVESSVPILKNIIHTPNGAYNKKQPCRNYILNDNSVVKFKSLSEHILGRSSFEYVKTGKNGYAVLGETRNVDTSQFIMLKSPPIDSYKITGTVLSPGNRGLEEAIQKGLIRRATEEDLNKWLDVLELKEKQSPSRNLPPVAGRTLRDLLPKFNYTHRTYVILDDFIFPSELHGAHSATFIVPKDVNSPKGDPGHSSVYDMKTGTCSRASTKC